MNYIFLQEKNNKVIYGIIESNKLKEVYEENLINKRLIGNIYRARVEKVVRGLTAAFVNIGEKKNAYLPLNKEFKDLDGNIVKGGDHLLVQVDREPIDEKGARIKLNLELEGKYIKLTPYDHAVKISNKIEHKEEIYRLLEIGENIISENIGFTFKESSIGLDKEIFEKEYEILVSLYNKIVKEKSFLPVPKLLSESLDSYLALILDIFSYKEYRILTNSRKLYEQILSLNKYYSFNLNEYIDIDYKFNYLENEVIKEGIEDRQKRKVMLKNGSNIIIEKTEALTVIDVNSHGDIKSIDLSATSLKVNKDAAKEIARQIRLRDIGGIIIVDFIVMDTREDRYELINYLKEEFRKDRNRPYIIGFTKLGLLEITRKRLGKDETF